MPTLPHVPPHDRIFARLEQFQLACPSCGRVFTSSQDQGHLAKNWLPEGKIRRPQREARAVRARHGHQRSIKSIKELTWNPFTQRLRCPWCRTHYIAGLLLYPAQGGGLAGVVDAPPDTVPTPGERRELARLAGGWVTEDKYRSGDPVNVYVPATCSCPAKGWTSDCPLHGNEAPPAASGA